MLALRCYTSLCPLFILIIFLFLYSWLEAGADIIETNTYQASVPGFKKHLGVTEEKALQVGGFYMFTDAQIYLCVTQSI